MRRIFSLRLDYVNDFFDDGLSVESSFSSVAELDLTVYERIQGVIFTHADVFAAKDASAALANNDRAWLCLLPFV